MSAALDADSGLPGPLPQGETVLWQGRPSPTALARRVLHVRGLVAYVAGLALLVAGSAWSEGWAPAKAASSLGGIAAAGAVLLALAWGFAFLVGRTTRYVITTRRIVMRIGVALPVTLNVPFAAIESADLRLDRDGTGDLPVTLSGNGRIGYVHLWPHARPWRVGRPQPMLRCVPDAAQVAAILSRALGGGPLGRAAAAREEIAREEPVRERPAALRPSVAA